MLKIVVLLVLALLQSCAASMGTKPQMLAIDSTPQGATVSCAGHDVGVTPCTISVGHQDRKVELRLAGHHPRVAHLGSASNGGLVVLGILLWGPFELLFDLGADAFSTTNAKPIVVPMTAATDGHPGDWQRPSKVTVDAEDS